MNPGSRCRRTARSARRRGCWSSCEHALATWQLASDAHAQSVAHGAARDAGRTRPHRAAGKSAAPLLQQQERQETERSTLAQLQPPVALETLTEQAELARERGAEGRDELAELLAELSLARDRRARADPGTQRLACAVAAGPGFAGVHRGAATGGARQGIGQGHPVAQGAFARPTTARRAATARRARLGAGGRNRFGLLPRSGVRRRPRQRSPICLASFDGGHLAVVSVSASHVRGAGCGLPAGEGAGRAVLGLGALVGVHGRDLGRGAQDAARLGAGSIGRHAGRHLDGRRLAAAVARSRAAYRRDRTRGVAARASRRGQPARAGGEGSRAQARTHPRTSARTRRPPRAKLKPTSTGCIASMSTGGRSSMRPRRARRTLRGA